MPKKVAVIYAVFIVLILTICYLSITIGSFVAHPAELLSTLLHINPNEQYAILLFELRLPRIVTAALVGLGLGIAGSVIQAMTRNGLADPGILGINAGAGAAIVGYMLIFQGQTETTSLLAAMGMPFFGLIGGIWRRYSFYVCLAWRQLGFGQNYSRWDRDQFGFQRYFAVPVIEDESE